MWIQYTNIWTNHESIALWWSALELLPAWHSMHDWHRSEASPVTGSSLPAWEVALLLVCTFAQIEFSHNVSACFLRFRFCDISANTNYERLSCFDVSCCSPSVAVWGSVLTLLFGIFCSLFPSNGLPQIDVFAHLHQSVVTQSFREVS